MKSLVLEPRSLSVHNITDIYDLISAGGQIKLAPSILLKQIVSCQLFALIPNDKGIPIAVAAIKVPQRSYVEKVFGYAGLKDAAQNYSYELGYCVTDEAFKGQGLCKKIVAVLLSQTSVARLFATTQSPAMAHILTSQGFNKVGKTHITEDNRKIDLYVYEF